MDKNAATLRKIASRLARAQSVRENQKGYDMFIQSDPTRRGLAPDQTYIAAKWHGQDARIWYRLDGRSEFVEQNPANQ